MMKVSELIAQLQKLNPDATIQGLIDGELYDIQSGSVEHDWTVDYDGEAQFQVEDKDRAIFILE